MRFKKATEYLVFNFRYETGFIYLDMKLANLSRIR